MSMDGKRTMQQDALSPRTRVKPDPANHDVKLEDEEKEAVEEPRPAPPARYLSIVARHGRKTLGARISLRLPAVGPEEVFESTEALRTWLHQQWGDITHVLYTVGGCPQEIVYTQFVSDLAALLQQDSAQGMQALLTPGARYEGLGTVTCFWDRRAQLDVLFRCDTGDAIEVTVKTLTGKTFFLPMATSDYVFDLKARVYDADGIPPDQQRLIFQSKQIEDMCTLADCNVQDGSAVHLVMRLKGS